MDDLTKDKIKKLILKEYRWYRYRPLFMTRPHSDHETNKKHHLTHIGEISNQSKVYNILWKSMIAEGNQ